MSLLPLGSVLVCLSLALPVSAVAKEPATKFLKTVKQTLDDDDVRHGPDPLQILGMDDGSVDDVESPAAPRVTSGNFSFKKKAGSLGGMQDKHELVKKLTETTSKLRAMLAEVQKAEMTNEKLNQQTMLVRAANTETRKYSVAVQNDIASLVGAISTAKFNLTEAQEFIGDSMKIAKKKNDASKLAILEELDAKEAVEREADVKGQRMLEIESMGDEIVAPPGASIAAAAASAGSVVVPNVAEDLLNEEEISLLQVVAPNGTASSSEMQADVAKAEKEVAAVAARLQLSAQSRQLLEKELAKQLEVQARLDYALAHLMKKRDELSQRVQGIRSFFVEMGNEIQLPKTSEEPPVPLGNGKQKMSVEFLTRHKGVKGQRPRV